MSILTSKDLSASGNQWKDNRPKQYQLLKKTLLTCSIANNTKLRIPSVEISIERTFIDACFITMTTDVRHPNGSSSTTIYGSGVRHGFVYSCETKLSTDHAANAWLVFAEDVNDAAPDSLELDFDTAIVRASTEKTNTVVWLKRWINARMIQRPSILHTKSHCSSSTIEA